MFAMGRCRAAAAIRDCCLPSGFIAHALTFALSPVCTRCTTWVQQHSDSTLRSPAADALLPAPPLLTVVSTSPCATMRRAVTVIRRSSLPNAPATDPGSRICRPVWLPMCSDSGSSAAETASVPCCPENIRGSLKRRSCPEPDSINTHVYEMQLQQPQQQPLRMPEAVTGPSSSELLPPSSPGSPASSFASFAAALAAHYYADFGSVPDVPEHLEQVRQRTGKRQRMGTVEQLDDV